MKITRRQLRQIIKEETRKLSEGWGIDTGIAIPKHGVTIGDVQDEAMRLDQDLYFINDRGKTYKVMSDGNLQGLPGDELPSGVDDKAYVE